MFKMSSALALSASSVAGRFSETPQNTAAIVGESVVLKCGSTHPDDTIVWREFITKPKDGQIIGEQDKLYHPSRKDRYKLHRIAANKYQLTIMNLKLEDAGLYSCYSTHAAQSISIEIIALSQYLLYHRTLHTCLHCMLS